MDLGTGNIYKSDLFEFYNIVQMDMLSYPKALTLEILRNAFQNDSYYRYVRDPWGFPKVVNTTDLVPDAGIVDDSTTRIFISERYKNAGGQSAIYYPSILVYNTDYRYKPISMNREKDNVIYTTTMVVDGYGNETTFVTPAFFLFAGAWEGHIGIDVLTRGLPERDELSEFLSVFFADIRNEELLRAGLFIKDVSAGNFTETDDRNDKLFKATITLDVRTEWRRMIPIDSIIDAINICVDLGRIDVNPPVIDPNLEINIYLSLEDEINAL